MSMTETISRRLSVAENENIFVATVSNQAAQNETNGDEGMRNPPKGKLMPRCREKFIISARHANFTKRANKPKIAMRGSENERDFSY